MTSSGRNTHSAMAVGGVHHRRFEISYDHSDDEDFSEFEGMNQGLAS